MDDNGDSNTTLTDTRQLVQQSNVFGMVYNTVGALPATTDFLQTNQVPFVGWGTLAGWCGTRWGFGYNGCLAAGAHRESSRRCTSTPPSSIRP